MRCGPKGLAMSGGAFSPDYFFKIWIRSNAIRRIQEPTAKSFFLTVSIHFQVWWSSECDGAFRSGNRTAGRTFYSFRLLLACVASVSAKNGAWAKKRKEGDGEGKEGSFLRSPPPPPSFVFLALAPFFARQKHRKSRSSVFLCSQTPRKRLLRRVTFVVAIVLFLLFFCRFISFQKYAGVFNSHCTISGEA